LNCPSGQSYKMRKHIKYIIVPNKTILFAIFDMNPQLFNEQCFNDLNTLKGSTIM